MIAAHDEIVPNDSPMRRFARRRFSIYAVWYVVGLLFCIAFGGLVARIFMTHTEAPAFTQLQDLVGQPLGTAIPQEILDEAERSIGPPPAVDPQTGAMSLVTGAFRTGNLPASSVHFVAWGPAVPYAFEGGYYWAVPFRYEADMGFGSIRQDSATALIRNGAVARFLYVPFWNFGPGLVSQ